MTNTTINKPAEEQATVQAALSHTEEYLAYAVNFEEHRARATEMLSTIYFMMEELDEKADMFQDALEYMSEDEFNGPLGELHGRPQKAHRFAFELLIALREMWGLTESDPRYVEISDAAEEEYMRKTYGSFAVA